MKRSHEPVFWLLFGAGGMLSALLGPVLVFIVGIAVPLGLLLPADTLRYDRVLWLVQHPLGKFALLTVIALFLFHEGYVGSTLPPLKPEAGAQCR
jgi:fumarate reductase subunit D